MTLIGNIMLSQLAGCPDQQRGESVRRSVPAACMGPFGFRCRVVPSYVGLISEVSSIAKEVLALSDGWR